MIIENIFIDTKKLNTLILSEQKDEKKDSCLDYLHKHIAYPDIGTEFDKQMGKTKYLLRIPIIGKHLVLPEVSKKMLDNGYDSQLLKYKNNFVGFTAYQINNEKNFDLPVLNMFRVYVENDFRGNNLGLFLIENLFYYCSNKGIPNLRIGNGNNEKVNDLVNIIKDKEYVFKKEYLGNNTFTLF